MRDALEKVESYHGLVKRFDHPFTTTRHEALSQDELLMARYNAAGVLVPVE